MFVNNGKITTPKTSKCEFLELKQNGVNFLDKFFAKQYCGFINEINLKKVTKNFLNPNCKHISKPGL